MGYRIITDAVQISYMGLSTDPKPTGVGLGMRLLEYDTQKTFITYDGNNWTEITGQPNKYYGLSTEAKPTVASHAGKPTPTPGSLYFEFTAADTATKIYCTIDGTTWHLLVQLV
jgi:hypothetical protein